MSDHASTDPLSGSANPQILGKNEIVQSGIPAQSESVSWHTDVVRKDAKSFLSQVIWLARERDRWQQQYEELLHKEKEIVTGGSSWLSRKADPKDKTIQDLHNEIQSLKTTRDKTIDDFHDKYSKKNQHLKDATDEVYKLRKQLEEFGTEKNNTDKLHQAKIRELGDESQQLRNALAFSAGDHQSWVLDSIVGELTQVKNKIKAMLFRLDTPLEKQLEWLALFSTLTFNIAIDLMGKHINDVTIRLGYPKNDESNPNRNSMAARTKLFIKSVLQINFGSINQIILSNFSQSLLAQLEQMTGEPRDNVESGLMSLGVDENMIKSLAMFALKLQLLEPPVRHRFEPEIGFPENRLLGELLNGKRRYLFPAIDQWSNQNSHWLQTQAQLTYID